MPREDFQFQKNCRVLITGGAGFIGSHLAETLLAQGAQVSVIDDLSTGHIENIRHLQRHSAFRFVEDSILHETVLKRLVMESDVVFHLAAAVGVMLIVDQPVRTITTNVMGTEAVLQAALSGGQKVMIASTSEVYGKGNRLPFREDDDVVLGSTQRSRWSYAASKLVDEFLALAYHREKNLPVVIFRLFNTIGSRQTGQYGMVVPRFVQQSLRGEPLTVFGNGRQSRCFLNVSDAVEALLRLAETPQAVGQVFNVGSTEEVTVGELARKIWSMTNSGTSPLPLEDALHFISYERAYAEGFEDMSRRVPDISKIQTLCGWAPRRSLETTLQEIIEVERSRLGLEKGFSYRKSG